MPVAAGFNMNGCFAAVCQTIELLQANFHSISEELNMVAFLLNILYRAGLEYHSQVAKMFQGS